MENEYTSVNYEQLSQLIPHSNHQSFKYTRYRVMNLIGVFDRFKKNIFSTDAAVGAILSYM